MRYQDTCTCTSHCFVYACLANQTNRCLADFGSRSDLFLDNEHG